MMSPAEKWFKVFARLGIPFLIIGILFKIMHWPAASVLITGSLLTIGVFSAAVFVVKKQKKAIDYIRLVLIESVVIYAILHFLHWPGKLVPGIILIASFMLWVWYDGLALNQKFPQTNAPVLKKISNLLLVLGGIITVLGIFLKILHWPGAGIILIVGIGCVAVSFFTGALKDE